MGEGREAGVVAATGIVLFVLKEGRVRLFGGPVAGTTTGGGGGGG